MTTTETVLLIILTVLLSIQLLFGIAVLAVTLKLIAAVRQVVSKAEEVVESVESAAEIFKDTEGKLAVFKLVRNIIKVAKKYKK